MSFNVEIEGVEKLKEILKKLPERIFPGVKSEYRKAIGGLHREMQERISGGVLKRRTGELSRSFISGVSGSKLSDVFGMVATRSKYAPIHEYGGAITPKTAKHLTIPLPDNKTKAGVTRKSARQLISEGKSFFRKSKRGNLILFTNNRGDLKPMFVLVDRVSIPARLGFSQTAQKWFESLLTSLIGLIERI